VSSFSQIRIVGGQFVAVSADLDGQAVDIRLEGGLPVCRAVAHPSTIVPFVLTAEILTAIEAAKAEALRFSGPFATDANP
jgi:hypothetical protein